MPPASKSTGTSRNAASKSSKPTATCPTRVLESIRNNDVALKGPITTPIGKGFRSVNVYLRQELGLFACIRPCKTYKGVRTYFCRLERRPGAGPREHRRPLRRRRVPGGRASDRRAHREINAAATGKKIGTGRDTTGVSIKPISYEGTRHIVEYAFDYAVKNGRKSVTSVCKANIMKFTDGLWYDETRAVALAYGAKFEWNELAEGVKPDPELVGKVTDSKGP